jgi:hypothetical protein
MFHTPNETNQKKELCGEVKVTKQVLKCLKNLHIIPRKLYQRYKVRDKKTNPERQSNYKEGNYHQK